MLLSYDAAVAAGPSVVGGKGWNLGRLACYGFDVPTGGILTADAYRAHLSAVAPPLPLGGGYPGGWGEGAEASASREDALDPATRAWLEEIRRAVEAAPLPSSVVEEVRHLLATSGLDTLPVAVRSSATREDGADASFAGIHESALNVVGLDAVLDAVKRCYGSLWTPRAVAYRRRLGLEDEALACAVVICQMVTGSAGPGSPPVAAGVAFTCDPRTGRRDRQIVNAVPGLGEALVGGQVEPEEIEVAVDERGRSRIVRRTTSPGTSAPVLADEQAVRLSRLLQRVHWALGDSQQPQDVEWAYDGERFWLVQARPVTRLPRLTYEPVRDLPIIWSNANLKDAVAGVPTVFGWSITQPLLRAILYTHIGRIGYPVLDGMETLRRIDGRAFFDLTTMEWVMYDALGVMPAELNVSLGGIQPELPMPSDRPFEGPDGRRRKLARLKTLKLLWRSARIYGRAIARIRAMVRAHADDDLSGLSNAEVLDWYARFGGATMAFARLFIVNNAGAFWDEVLGDLIERARPGQGARIAAGLLAGSNAVVTAEHGYRLIDLARLAESDPAARAYLEAMPRDPHGWRALPPTSAFRRAFGQFLEEFGHRGVYEVEVANPRWREDPTYLLDQVQALLDHHQRLGGRERAAGRRQAAETELRSLPLWMRPIVGWLAERPRRAAALREAGKSALVSTLILTRKLTGELGKRMAAAGLLDDPADVYNLSWWDVTACATGEWDGAGARALVADRVAQRSAWLTLEPPDVIVLDVDGHPAELPAWPELATKAWPLRPSSAGRSEAEHARLIAAGRMLSGAGVAPGRVGGPARLIRHPDEGARLQVGDVLVAPSTDPGWTPIFLRASAIVMEVGGYLSHGAIVAREYGLPAVVNVPNALTTIQDGQMLEVDGDTGEVLLVDS